VTTGADAFRDGAGHAPALMADVQIRLIEDFLLAETVAAQPNRRAASGTGNQ
jgi:hypothetical protein